MDKPQIIQLVVMLIVIGFIAEQFYFSSQGSGFNIFNFGSVQSKITKGTTTFNGTVRNYDNMLVLDSNTSQSIIESVRNLEYVRGVTQQNGYWIVTTQSREDIPTLARILNEQNTSALARININVPDTIEVLTNDGAINASTFGQNQIIKIVTNPIVNVEDNVIVQMDAEVTNKVLTNYSSAQLMFGNLEAIVNATVIKFNQMTSESSIPWEQRNSMNISNESRKVNTIVFSPPLTNQQMIEKRALEYITYISSDSAEVREDFINKTKIIEDFNGTRVDFLPSKSVTISDLMINTTNNTPATYNYRVLLPNSIKGHVLEEMWFDLNFNSSKEINSTVQLNISAHTIGQRIYSIRLN